MTQKSEERKDLLIRNLCPRDFSMGYFETLASLRSVEGLTVEEAKRLFHDMEHNGVYRHYVAVEEGQVVGVITLLIEQKYVRNGAKAAHIEDVAVREEWRGKGIGKTMVEYAIAEAKKFGCYKVILDCTPDNVTFSEKCGFKPAEIQMRISF